MGFNRRKLEDQHREAAEKEAAIRDRNQNQHAERGHCELESYDEQGGIEF